MREQASERQVVCDCGFEMVAPDDAQLVQLAQSHALDAHRTRPSADMILALARGQASRRQHPAER